MILSGDIVIVDCCLCEFIRAVKIIGVESGIVCCFSIRASISAVTLIKTSGMFIAITSYTTAATLITVGPVVAFRSGGLVAFPRDYKLM